MQKRFATVRDKWQTPAKLYNELHNEFTFDFDPCPIEWSPDTHEDGLTIEWGERTFCNPPYSLTKQFIKKAHEEAQKGKIVIMLINVITDTIAFHEYIYGKQEVRFIKGRLHFTDRNHTETKPTVPNGRPSMVVVFRKI